MAPKSEQWAPENMRDAIVAYSTGKLDIQKCHLKFNVPTRKLRSVMNELNQINKMRE